MNELEEEKNRNKQPTRANNSTIQGQTIRKVMGEGKILARAEFFSTALSPFTNVYVF